MGETTGNRRHKDSLFRAIFKEKQALLSLYNAINQSDYQNPEELEVTTIEDILYMGMKNDVSFLIDSYMNLYEAQSTWIYTPFRSVLTECHWHSAPKHAVAWIVLFLQTLCRIRIVEET
jgi:hypothetical protein